MVKKNVNLVFLPPNTTFTLQLLDQEITHSLQKEASQTCAFTDFLLKIHRRVGKTGICFGCNLVHSEGKIFLVATGKTTKKSKKELADLVANLDSNVSIEEYVKITGDISTEEENHQDTTDPF